jgi:hypothetical protein
MARNRHRTSFSLVVLVLTVAAVGCGHTETKWHEAKSASGNYVAEFPGEPTTRTQTAPGSDMSIQLTLLESEGNAFNLSETALQGNAPYPLDDAVDMSVESARAGQEKSAGRTVTATELSRTTGDFEGVETRRFSYTLVVGDARAIMSSLLFYRDDVIVQAIVVSDSEADSEAVNHFLSSVRLSTD